MQVLLLCRFNEEAWGAIPRTERAAIMKEYHAVLDDLEREGRHVATAKLEPVAAGRTLRHDGDGPVTDGPFLETKEHLGGVHLIECDDLEQATAIAGRFPTLAAGGTIEVRPLMPGGERWTG